MLKLDKNELEEGIGIIIKAGNEDLIEDINKLAAALKNEADNDLLKQVYENCKKFQSLYNDTARESINGLVNDFKAVFDITEMLEKASVSDVTAVDAGFKTSGIDADSVAI